VPETGPAPDADELELQLRLRECAATGTLADGIVARIEGGLSNRAWRLDARGERWFVRLGHPQAARLGVDRRSECEVLRAASSAGLAPQVRACDPATGLLVTRFIDGATWRAADATTDVNIRRIAECLRRLHALPIPEGVHSVDYQRQARHLSASLSAMDATARTLHARAAEAFERIDAARLPATLCHNDLHHLNILDDGTRLWLVDWEYGGRGNPLFDIAGFLALHDFGPGPTAAFLDAYGWWPPADRRWLEDARWLFDYVQWLWYRSRFPSPAGDEAWYAERLSRRLLRCNN
jgi:thiamine kinase-like enzyme